MKRKGSDGMKEHNAVQSDSLFYSSLMMLYKFQYVHVTLFLRTTITLNTSMIALGDVSHHYHEHKLYSLLLLEYTESLAAEES